MSQDLCVALVSDVFFGGDAEPRLGARLRDAREGGARLAVLPEIPLNPWSPATRVARDEDAESPGGPRHEMLARAARASGIGVVGGAIVREGGRRFNTALVFDGRGEL